MDKHVLIQCFELRPPNKFLFSYEPLMFFIPIIGDHILHEEEMYQVKQRTFTTIENAHIVFLLVDKIKEGEKWIEWEIITKSLN